MPCQLFVFVQGIAGSVATSNFFRAFLMISLFHSLRVNEINSSQPSGILELLFSLAQICFSFIFEFLDISRILATHDQALMFLAVSSISLPDHMYQSGGISSVR